MAGLIKDLSPATRIVVVAAALARPVWERCAHVDEIITVEELEAAGDEGAVGRLAALKAGAIVHVHPDARVARWAKRARIPRRVGSNRFLLHWRTCNALVSITRKRSTLHEAQLCIALLKPFRVAVPQPFQALAPFMGLSMPETTPAMHVHLRPDMRNIILHTMSHGGERWGLRNFAALMRMLDPARDRIILTGTASEAAAYRAELPVGLPNVTDLGGALSVDELWSLIAGADALVAGSTGPLHLAAAAGIRTIGLYGNFRAINPARWAPIGPDVRTLVYDPNCPTCLTGSCDCITRIPPERVLALLQR